MFLCIFQDFDSSRHTALHLFVFVEILIEICIGMSVKAHCTALTCLFLSCSSAAQSCLLCSWLTADSPIAESSSQRVKQKVMQCVAEVEFLHAETKMKLKLNKEIPTKPPPNICSYRMT